MSLDALIMFVGFLVALLPFLGFPVNWDDAFFTILGIIVIALGVAVRRRGNRPILRRRSRREREFVESEPHATERREDF